MANAYITQIELPSGTTYDLHDSRVDSINNWDYQVCTSAANTPKDVTWTSGSTTITGTLVASADTMYKIYLVPDNNGTSDIYDEYITVRTGSSGSYTYTWEMFGNTKLPDLPDMNDYVKNASGHSGGTAGALAYKSSASGTVAVPKTYTSTYTPAAKNVSVSGTTTGSVSSSFTGTGVRLITSSKVGTDVTFTGASMTSTGSLTTETVDIKPNSSGTSANKYTPAGTNASSSVSGTCSVTPTGSISVGTGTANYTPAGSIVESSSPATTIKNPTSKTVVTDMSVADPSGTAATGELIYYSVSGTKLSLKKIVETTGASISTSNVSVKKGDASYSFSGTGTELKFTGSASSGTISGTAAAQTFTGTGTYLKTAKAVTTDSEVSVSGTTAGTATLTTSNVAVTTTTGTATYTPEGTVTSTFTGANMTSTGSYTPAAGTISTTTATTENKTVTVS